MNENYQVKKKYFLFAKPHKNHLLFLLFLIVPPLKQYIKTLLSENSRIVQQFLELNLYNIGDLISIIPFLIVKKRTSSIKMKLDSNKENPQNDDFIFNNPEDKNEVKSFKLIFLFTFVDFISQIISLIYYIILSQNGINIKFEKLHFTLIINIIFIFFFSLLLLHNTFYKHHYFSLIINLFFLLILVIIDSFEIKAKINSRGDENGIKYEIIYILVKIAGTILYSFEDVLLKILFLKHYYSAYTILLYKAIYQIVYIIIFYFPFFFIELNNQDEKDYIYSMIKKFYENQMKILWSVIFSIISFFYNIFIFKIIEIFDPNHFAITRVFENFGILFYGIIEKKDEDKEKKFFFILVLKIIIYIILFISVAIFNEIIIINICGLSEKTKLFLDQESKLEKLCEKTDENLDDVNLEHNFEEDHSSEEILPPQ